MTLALLAAVAVIEAVVYQGRYRATHGTPWAAGAWTFAVCVLRLAFVVGGVMAMVKGEPWWAVVGVYALPAALVTGIVRAREMRAEKVLTKGVV